MSDPQTAAANSNPTIALDDLLAVISNLSRWKLLRELPSGEPFMVLELAERVRLSPDVVSKHLALFRHAGIVLKGRNRLYQLAPQFLADKTNRVLDFGWCLLRTNARFPDAG
jgi:DNA-binding transcriptional ArsR family regulator